MALCFLRHTDETDKADDNGSFILFIGNQGKKKIRSVVIRSIRLVLCAIKD